jgi:hypothetical protein
MNNLELKDYGIKIGDGEKLVVMAGLNVLEDEGLAQEVCAELKAICAELDLPYIFKASWDKANRSSITSYRGPGIEEGLPMLDAVKAKHGVPVVTDLHEAAQAEGRSRDCRSGAIAGVSGAANRFGCCDRTRRGSEGRLAACQESAIPRAVGLRQYHLKNARSGT